MPWKKVFHAMEKSAKVFPLRGKIAETFSTPRKPAGRIAPAPDRGGMAA